MGWFEGQLWKWTLAWKRELTQNELQLADELYALLSHQHPNPTHRDTILWKGSPNYKAKDLQKLLTVTVEVDSLVCTVWMNLSPPKVEFFMWLALLGKLNTKEVLLGQEILSNGQTVCSLCSLESESIDHVLMKCNVSWKLWRYFAAELG